MVEINNIDTQIENVDQLPVIYGLLQKMNIQLAFRAILGGQFALEWKEMAWYSSFGSHLKKMTRHFEDVPGNIALADSIDSIIHISHLNLING